MGYDQRTDQEGLAMKPTIEKPDSYSISAHDLLKRNAEKALACQTTKGYMPSGHNGPYHDPETPVRNTAHWLMTFAYMYKDTGDSRYFNAVLKAGEYLCSTETRPHGFTHIARTSKGVDRCNGLIGPAWVIEALSEATIITGERQFSELGYTVFALHPFMSKKGLWTRVDIDGTHVGMDETFNHQLWFAAAAAQLVPLVSGQGAQRLKERIGKFLEMVPTNMLLYEDGLVFHALKPPSYDRQTIPKSVLGLRKDVAHRIKFLPGMKDFIMRRLRSKCVGYHHFNTYAFAMLRETFPNSFLWNHRAIYDVSNVLLKPWFKQEMTTTSFGYEYNSPWFLIPYSLRVLLGLSIECVSGEVAAWKDEQLSRCYNEQTAEFTKENPDPITFNARMYELTRFPDLHAI